MKMQNLSLCGRNLSHARRALSELQTFRFPVLNRDRGPRVTFSIETEPEVPIVVRVGAIEIGKPNNRIKFALRVWRYIEGSDQWEELRSGICDLWKFAGEGPVVIGHWTEDEDPEDGCFYAKDVDFQIYKMLKEPSPGECELLAKAELLLAQECKMLNGVRYYGP